MIRYITMHHLPGYSKEFVLLQENLLKVQLLIMLMKGLVDKYFQERFRYKEIITLLKNRHGIKVSLLTLHRFLRRPNFYRKGKQSPLLDTVTFIQHEVEGSGFCIVYRVMQRRCIRNGLMVSLVIVA